MSDDELIHRRVLRAPRELVWQCLTEPEELTQFWAPAGMSTPLDGIVVELREGGRFETLMTGEHGDYRMVATFTEIVAPERLGWIDTTSDVHTTSTLSDLGDGTTELVIHQRHVPDAMREPEAQAGFLSSLDKLERHVAQRVQQLPHDWIATAYDGWADLLETDPAVWDAPTLCEGWLVRHLVAHVTMPVRLTPEQYGAEMAAAGGDFTVLSNAVAARDATLPETDLLSQLRAPALHAWEPPGGGATGALIHAVVHCLDVTLALGKPAVAPAPAIAAVLETLTASDGSIFGVNPTGAALEEVDIASRVALLSGRTLPDGRSLPRR